jgi:hypothetical protein
MDEPLKAAAPKPCCVCAAPNGKHCAKCKSRHYCSKACQLVDWKEGGHKEQCRQLAAEFQDRLLDELMPKKKVKEEPAIVEDISPAAGFKAAPRLSAVPTDKTAVEGTAVDDDAPSWRGICAICLDLPSYGDNTTFYSCCCKVICTACSNKWLQHDNRCPLCRTPAPMSHAEVMRQLQKHVDKGQAGAQMHLGEAYYYGDVGLKQNLKRGFQLFELAAAQGHAKAQVRLAGCYLYGRGVEVDYEAAALWYRRAAEQGHPEAQYNLGEMFVHGRGVAQSFDEAAKWWRLAAAQGDADALRNLGGMYQNGDSVPQDDTEALRLFELAAKKGHARAAALVAEF